MKKLLFVINHMNMGGIQVSLLEILNRIHAMYDITVLCIRQGGELSDRFPSDVKVIAPGRALLCSELSMREAAAQKVFGRRLVFQLWSRLFSRRLPACIVTRFLQRDLGRYDAAISFTQPIGSRQFFNLSNETVLNACTAGKKITFLHCDFQQYGGNDAVNRALYRKFDAVAAVSESVGERLAQEIPDIRGRIVTVYNCCDTGRIRALADEEPICYEERFPVVTAARLSEEKGLRRCVKLFRELRRGGADIRWHIIGDGGCRSALEEEIRACGAEDIVLLHGQQANPYRYMKNAALFLLPSFHEAAPMVYAEAACLGVPVLTTPTISAEELVGRKGRGIVCGMDTESIGKALRDFVEQGGCSVRPDADDEDSRAAARFAALIEA